MNLKSKYPNIKYYPEKKYKVIGVGLPKTGTTTLISAMEAIGMKHKVDFVAGDFVHLMENWDADNLILTVRKDSLTWIRSYVRWVEGYNNPFFKDLRSQLYGTSNPAIDNGKMFISAYERHNNALMKIKNCTVLCWENGDSWAELCAALGVNDVPEIDFPHKNKN